MLIPITALYAGICGALAVTLANHVLWVRIRTQMLPKWRPNAAERVHANFVENVPLALVLLLLIELNGAPAAIVHTFGGSLVVLRLLHAFGLGTIEKPNYPRLIGAQGTFLLLSVMSFALVLASLNN